MLSPLPNKYHQNWWYFTAIPVQQKIDYWKLESYMENNVLARYLIPPVLSWALCPTNIIKYFQEIHWIFECWKVIWQFMWQNNILAHNAIVLPPYPILSPLPKKYHQIFMIFHNATHVPIKNLISESWTVTWKTMFWLTLLSPYFLGQTLGLIDCEAYIHGYWCIELALPQLVFSCLETNPKFNLCFHKNYLKD